MPADPADAAACTAHADLLSGDARLLAACADRLRAVETALTATGTAPPWLHEAVSAHLIACASAAADLRTAATRLREHAQRLTGP
jgi:hypothetical protein